MTDFDEYEPQQYVKLPIPITAQRMRERFTVKTLEGTLDGKPGDYLMTGVSGEQYPCDAAIFAKTYRRAEAPAQDGAKAPGVDRCPDGGACHHDCVTPDWCWRKSHGCLPLSGSGLNGDWSRTAPAQDDPLDPAKEGA